MTMSEARRSFLAQQEADRPPARVWILGAGFSRGVGGPLMDQLLSPWGYRRALSIFGRPEFQAATWQAFALYHFGTGFRLGPVERIQHSTKGQQCWSDAEEYLEDLSTATSNPRRHEALAHLWNDLRVALVPGSSDVQMLPIRKFEQAARCAVAAATSAFHFDETRESVREKERWNPYLRWFRHLGDNDTLITFNYDSVVELLSDDGGQCVNVEGISPATSAGAGPLLCKLHGSTDWFEKDGGFAPAQNTFDRIVSLQAPLIAVPGPSKAAFSSALFAGLWKKAEDAIRSADQIFFVGYRFPKTDAVAAHRLLDALAQNPKPKLRVFTCLGPEVRGGDSMRMIHLLHGARPRSLIHWEPEAAARPSWATEKVKQGIHPLPLWAEDLLSSWARTMSG